MEGWMFTWRDAIDIALTAVVVYFVLRLIRGTRAVQMIMGLAVLFLVYEVARLTGLLTLEWIFSQFFSAFIIILVIIFQHDIRRALLRMGINPLSQQMQPGMEFVESLVDACFALVHQRWGGLIVLERETGLKHLYETGVVLDAPVRSDVLQSIFCPQAPMHDGAIIVHNGRIVAARVLLPLAQASALPGKFGTRHRAAVGISEESDAFVIVVSEETGQVRVAENGVLSEPLDRAGLCRTMMDRFAPDAREGRR